MEQKEFNELMDAQKDVIIKAAEAKVSDVVKAEVEKATADIRVKAEGWEKKAKDLEIEMAVQKKFNAGASVNPDQFEAKLKENEANLKSMIDNRNGSVSFDLKAFNTKAAANLTLANYTGGTYGLTQMDGESSKPGRRSPFLRQIVRSFPVSNKYITWVELINRDGGAGQTAEGTAKTLADFDYQEQSKQVEKITSFMKASKESLDDIPRLQSDIQSELVELVQLKLDADLLSGTGTSPAIKGILGYAPTISVTGTPFITTGGGVKASNRMDVIRIAAWVIQNNYFQASHVLLNSVDAAQMDLVKDANGQYILPPFSTSEHSNIAGLRVVVNNGVTAGTFLAGDFSKSNLGIREDINLSIGYDQDDFTKNMVTILAEARAVHYIKANHIPAFVQGTFSTVITATSV